jgi:hypothetical protein
LPAREIESIEQYAVIHMSHDIKESDWKALRQLHAIALERFSVRILDELHRITSAKDRSAHARYLDVFRLIRERDDEMAHAFNDMRRSRAFQRLVAIQSLELLTAEELERLSPEMRESLRAMLEILG